MSAPGKIAHRWQLEVYRLPIQSGMEGFETSKTLSNLAVRRLPISSQIN